MKKTLLILIILIILIISVNIAIACKEIYTDKEDVIVFDVIEEDGAGANCNISLYNSTAFISDRVMVANGNKYTYNYEKNLSSNETYRGIIECEKGSMDYNSECTFIVEKEVDSEFYLYVVAIIVMITLIVLGYYQEDSLFIITGGFLSAIIAVNIFVNGFPNLTNVFLKNGITVILAGIGFYFIVAPSLEFFENFKSGGKED